MSALMSCVDASLFCLYVLGCPPYTCKRFLDMLGLKWSGITRKWLMTTCYKRTSKTSPVDHLGKLRRGVIMFGMDETVKLLTAIGAILTGIAGVLVLVWYVTKFIIERKDKEARAKVELMVGSLINGSELNDRMFILSIANIAEETIKLVSVELKWKKQKLFFIQDQLQGDKNFTFEM